MKIVRFSHNGQSPRLGILEGKDREYRQPYIALMEAVHRGTANDASLAACFPGDTLATIDAEFREWLTTLEITTPEEKEEK